MTELKIFTQPMTATAVLERERRQGDDAGHAALSQLRWRVAILPGELVVSGAF